MSYAGIDLGTTTSSISVNGEDNIRIVPFTNSSIIPSYISFEKDNILYGEAAKNKMSKNLQNTVYDIKRFIGKKIIDPEIQEDLKNLTYKLIGDKNNNPLVEINIDGEKKLYTPEDISSLLLKYLIDNSSNFNGRSIDSVVICVPAYFNQNQKSATLKAGEKAGVEILGLVNEPTAAAYAYGFQQGKVTNPKKILIFDFGGGTFDVSIIELKPNEIKVIGTGGNNHLGGRDIDARLVKYFLDKYLEETGEDIKNSAKKMRKLKDACEKLKIQLTESEEASADVEFLEENNIEKISRSYFEHLCMSIFYETLDCVKATLKKCNLRPDDISDIILIGGSSRIPKVIELINGIFPKSKVNKSINPDEAVTIGAGLYARQLYVDKYEIPNQPHGGKVLVQPPRGGKILVECGGKVLVHEAIIKSIGIEGINAEGKKIMRKILIKDNPIDDKRIDFFLSQNYATDAYIDIYEGEEDYTRDCTFINEYHFSGFTSNPKGTLIEITYSIDKDNNLLNLIAKADGKEINMRVGGVLE